MAKNLIEEVEDLMDILKMRIDKLKKSFDRLDTVVRPHYLMIALILEEHSREKDAFRCYQSRTRKI